jgi:hypothetical protein
MERLPADKEGREAWAKQLHEQRARSYAKRFRKDLIEWYGEEKGEAVEYAEAFELCEYGRSASVEELKRLFPFFGR